MRYLPLSLSVEIRKIKCGAGERRRRRLDGADPLFLPSAKMQTNLQRVIPYSSIAPIAPQRVTKGRKYEPAHIVRNVFALEVMIPAKP